MDSLIKCITGISWSVRPGQEEFRNSLIAEHRQYFERHPLFCELSLFGVLARHRPVLLEAHHIVPYSICKNEWYCNELFNGLLIAKFVHRHIHQLNFETRIPVERLTRQYARDSFEGQYHEVKHYRLPQGGNLAEKWEDLLASKYLIPRPSL